MVRRRRRRWALVGAAVVVIAGGVTWAATRSSTATNDSETPKVLFAALDDITCSSSDRCLAVGSVLPAQAGAPEGDPDGDGQPTRTLAESFGHGRWTVGRSLNEGRGGAAFSAVSCPTASNCVAVGYYRPMAFPLGATSAPPSYPLIETYHDGVWQIAGGPSVAPDTELSGVSCTSVSRCVAVGYSVTGLEGADAVELPVVEDFDGRSWSETPVPTPAGTSSSLDSVSCPGVSSCVAVGSVSSLSDLATTHPLIDTLSAGVWSSVPLPGYDAQPGSLHGVQCLSVGQCVAVGNTLALRSSGSALVLTSDGSQWTGDSAAIDEPGDVTLTSLSCSTVSRCVVVGSSWDSPFKILARMDGPAWEELRVSPLTANLDSVSCPTRSTCRVVGSVPRNTVGNTTALRASVAGRALTVDGGSPP